ncbi:MAG: hypothetical protein M3N93_03595 [Acidobacteriota bacterium]|nr:hypothetical protein [Acidobacteriota bacterium]
MTRPGVAVRSDAGDTAIFELVFGDGAEPVRGFDGWTYDNEGNMLTVGGMARSFTYDTERTGS